MFRRSLMLMIALSATVLASDVHAPVPPTQPAAGPGGSDYPFADISMHRYGEADGQYWIFEPASPTPKSCALIIFNHGWSAMSPNIYGAWIKHLVRRGNIVIYPRYQAALLTPMINFTPNAVAAVKAALVELQGNNHVKPELDRVAIVGHSMGGAITANLAALALAQGLPVPKAICCVEPGNHARGILLIHMPMADLGKISPDTLVQVIVGEDDRLAGDDTAKMIFAHINQVPDQKKDYVILMSDDHGSPAIVANHFAPVALETVDPDPGSADFLAPFDQRRREKLDQSNKENPLHYYGIWKLFDGLTDAAFFGKNINYALGNTPEQRYMGKWSDGTPVKELKITEHP